VKMKAESGDPITRGKERYKSFESKSGEVDK
jgi:hypothetical protein